MTFWMKIQPASAGQRVSKESKQRANMQHLISILKMLDHD
jgi:hypothetical protein